MGRHKKAMSKTHWGGRTGKMQLFSGLVYFFFCVFTGGTLHPEPASNWLQLSSSNLSKK